MIGNIGLLCEVVRTVVGTEAFIDETQLQANFFEHDKHTQVFFFFFFSHNNELFAYCLFFFFFAFRMAKHMFVLFPCTYVTTCHLLTMMAKRFGQRSGSKLIDTLMVYRNLIF